VPRGQREESLLRYSRLSIPEPLLFLSSSSSAVLTRLSGPRSRPTTSQTTLTTRPQMRSMFAIRTVFLKKLDKRLEYIYVYMYVYIYIYIYIYAVKYMN
jgi:hypothetical protein